MPTPANSLTVELRHSASRVLKAFYCAVLVLASFLIVFSGAAPQVIALALAINGLGGFLIWRQIQFLDSVTGILVRDRNLELICNGEYLPVGVVGDRLIHEFIITFSCSLRGDKPRRRKAHMVILPDSMPRQDRRLLRVLLKVQAHY